VIEMLDWYLRELRITGTELRVNSIGDENCRPAYIARLKESIRERLPNLCGSCRQRYETNPLRVLDCKIESCQPYLDELPAITDALCDACKAHFEQFRLLLDQRGIGYTVTPKLVRGLDYYMRTAFEIVGSRLGAQNTIVGGGRYDGLSQMLGGPPAKGFGFAFGVERMIMSLPDSSAESLKQVPDLFIAYIGERARAHSFALAGRLREAGIGTVVDLEGRKLKKALAIANNIGARYALIVGDDEIDKGSYVLRDMTTGEQKNLGDEELIPTLTR
jgi:histidyl-tRNA synthetase